MGRGELYARADFNYVDPPCDGKELAVWSTPKHENTLDPKLFAMLKYDPTQKPIYDMRTRDPKEMSLDKNGFVFRKREEVFRGILKDDEWNDEKVKEVYFPRIVQIVKEEMGLSDDAVAIHGGQHIRRGYVPGQKNYIAVFHVHTDANVESAHDLAARCLKSHGYPPEEIERLLKLRVRFIHVWHPIKHVAYDTPLSLLDWNTLNPRRDVINTKVYSSPETTFNMDSFRANPQHEWWSVSEQRPDEILLWKGYDSTDADVARFIPHSAFKHPDFWDRLNEASRERGIEAKQRESCDVRLWVFGE